MTDTTTQTETTDTMPSTTTEEVVTEGAVTEDTTTDTTTTTETTEGDEGTVLGGVPAKEDDAGKAAEEGTAEAATVRAGRQFGQGVVAAVLAALARLDQPALADRGGHGIARRARTFI